MEYLTSLTIVMVLLLLLINSVKNNAHQYAKAALFFNKTFGITV